MQWKALDTACADTQACTPTIASLATTEAATTWTQTLTTQRAQPKPPLWKLILGMYAGAAIGAVGGEIVDALLPADSAETALADIGEDGSDDALAGCGESFTAGTKVLLASGAAVPISQLKPGDKVLATNTKTGKTLPEAVTAVMVKRDTNKYDLTIRSGHRTANIDTTRNHLFWDVTRGRWVKAGALKHHDRLRTSNGAVATVVSGHTPEGSAGWMWDISVPGGNDHDFYIDTAAATILVHNCSPRFSLRQVGTKIADKFKEPVNYGKVFKGGIKNAGVGGVISFGSSQICPDISNHALAYGCLVAGSALAGFGGAWAVGQSLELMYTYAAAAFGVSGTVGGIVWLTTGKP